MKNNFIQRTITGFFFAAIIIGSILFSEYGYLAFAAIAIIAGLLEFSRLVEPFDVQINRKYILPTGLSVLAGVYISLKYKNELIVFLALLFNSGMWVNELFRKSKNPFHNIAYSVLAIVYIAIPFSLLLYTLFLPGHFYPNLALFIFFIIWANDTFAYLFGRILGKHKLFPSISPKKTWEGAVGGALSALVIAYFLSLYQNVITEIQFLTMAALIVLLGNYGDLVQSMLKRSLGVKDSGHILPGHGGILDRFDSFLFAAPIATIYLIIVA